MTEQIKLTTGVDIVNVNRISKILLDRRESFYKKVFTENEIAYISRKGHKATTVAGIFAAKEAVSKAMGTGIGLIGWKDIEILQTDGGKPYVCLSDKGKNIASEHGIDDIQLSISHEIDYAIAFVVGYKL